MSESNDHGSGNRNPQGFRERRGEVERFVAAQRAARAVESSALALWNALIDAADAAVTDESLELLYEEAMVGIRDTLDADSVAFLLASESGKELVARASVGLGEKGTVGLRIEAGEGLAGRVLASKKPLVVDDLDQVTLAWPTLHDQGMRSVVAVPIISDNGVLGVLHAGSRELAHFTSADAELLESLADRVALALERVQLMEHHRRLADLGSFLAATARIMAEASDLTETLERLAATALPALGDICLIDLIDDGSLTRLVAKHRDPAKQHLVDRLRTEFPPEPEGPHPAVKVMRSGQVSWSTHMSDDFLRSTTRSEEHFALTKALGFRAYLAVPIEADQQVLGTLTMVSCSRRFRIDDLELAQALATQVGAQVGNAQRLDIAAKTSLILQAALLPRALPSVPGLSVCSRYEAASKNLDVGGDFYDVMLLPDGTAWFMIGDVEGHDRGAAALMGQFRSAARILAIQGAGPADLIEELQSSWTLMDFDRIATGLFGTLDPAGGTLTVACAGHYPPLVIDSETAEFLTVPASPPFGSAEGRPEEWEGYLEPGQILFLYTDGVVSDRRIGVERNMVRLRQVARGIPHEVQAVCERVLHSHPNHEDDIALLAIQRFAVPTNP